MVPSRLLVDSQEALTCRPWVAIQCSWIHEITLKILSLYPLKVSKYERSLGLDDHVRSLKRCVLSWCHSPKSQEDSGWEPQNEWNQIAPMFLKNGKSEHKGVWEVFFVYPCMKVYLEHMCKWYACIQFVWYNHGHSMVMVTMTMTKSIHFL